MTTAVSEIPEDTIDLTKDPDFSQLADRLIADMSREGIEPTEQYSMIYRFLDSVRDFYSRDIEGEDTSTVDLRLAEFASQLNGESGFKDRDALEAVTRKNGIRKAFEKLLSNEDVAPKLLESLLEYTDNEVITGAPVDAEANKPAQGEVLDGETAEDLGEKAVEGAEVEVKLSGASLKTMMGDDESNAASESEVSDTEKATTTGATIDGLSEMMGDEPRESKETETNEVAPVVEKKPEVLDPELRAMIEQKIAERGYGQSYSSVYPTVQLMEYARNVVMNNPDPREISSIIHRLGEAMNTAEIHLTVGSVGEQTRYRLDSYMLASESLRRGMASLIQDLTDYMQAGDQNYLLEAKKKLSNSDGTFDQVVNADTHMAQMLSEIIR